MRLRSFLCSATATRTVAYILAVVGISIQAAVTTTIPDSGFEPPGAPDVSGRNNHQAVFNTGAPIGYWKVSEGFVTLYTTPNIDFGPTYQNSKQSVALEAWASVPGYGGEYLVFGGVSQTINNLIQGQLYRLEFAYGSADGYGPGSVQVGVYVNRQIMASGSFTIPTDNAWTTGTFDFRAPATSVVLSFRSSLTIGDGAAAIDGPMTLTEIPEPCQFALMGLLGMIGIATRRLVASKQS